MSDGDVCEGDVGEAAMPVVWGVPWWRSPGVLLGLPGLAFLVWVWVGSYSKASLWKSMGYAQTPSTSYVGTMDRELWLNRGAVIFSRGKVLEVPPGTVLIQDPVHFEIMKPERCPVVGLDPVEGLWGMERKMSNRIVFPELSYEKTRWWVSIGVVVAGYVGVWLGLMVVWRWWVRRRFARVVGMTR